LLLRYIDTRPLVASTPTDDYHIANGSLSRK